MMKANNVSGQLSHLSYGEIIFLDRLSDESGRDRHLSPCKTSFPTSFQVATLHFPVADGNSVIFQ